MKKTKTPATKIISFLGMILSMKLMIVLALLYFSLRENIGSKEIILFISAMIISILFFSISLVWAVQFKWGNKNSFTPMV